MYKELVGQVIDHTKDAFKAFPSCLDGEVYVAGSEELGWTTRQPVNKATIGQTVQDYLDRVAQTEGFNSIESIGKYVGYANLQREKAEALGTWCAEVEAFVQTQKELPKTLDALVPELPKFVKGN